MRCSVSENGTHDVDQHIKQMYLDNEASDEEENIQHGWFWGVAELEGPAVFATKYHVYDVEEGTT